ncbi:MFS transporter [Actinomadura parmotrematis]|uniref:MFS transporter n=1 Tax=Actinomadura parmotrematis TaxID=2864039 RepID=A0ABS7G3M0_9ACTN|nr:MFS transporter [Actinomadura parmotrematis]MBW8486825.1 MFS transporter [Actinomadura parmotrematis]
MEQVARDAPPAAGTAWWKVFAGLLAALFTTFTAFGAVIPVLPRLVVDEHGGSPLAVGALFTCTAIVALLVRPYGGQAAQRFGCRRVMAAGAGIAVAVGVLYTLPLGLPGLFAARLVMGVGEALLFTAGSVWTVHLAPEHRRGQIVGWYGLAMWSGLSAGPALGELLYRTGSYAAVWTAAVALPAVALLVLSRLPRDADAGAAVSRRLLPPAAILPGLSLAAGAFGYAVIVGFGALALADRGLPNGPVLLSVFSAAYVGVRLLAGRLPDRVGPVKVIMVSSGCEAAGLLLVGLAPSWWAAALGALVAGGGFTLLYPSLALITIDRAPEAERGAALGAVSSFLDLSVGVAGLVGGAVAELSYPATFALAALLVLGSLPVVPVAARGVRRGS